jgi:ATP-dependent DNA helicase RecG
VESAKEIPLRARKGTLLKVVLATETQRIDATFFSGGRVKHVIKTGVRGMFSGKVKIFRGKPEITHPSYLILPEPGGENHFSITKIRGAGELAGLARASSSGGGELDMSIFERDLIPIYPATADVESWTIMGAVRRVLEQLGPVEDPVPQGVLDQQALIGLDRALREVHLPETREDIERAQARLRFDEALALQLVLAGDRQRNSGRAAPPCPPAPSGAAAEFDANLPFSLTDGQKEVAAEISADISRPHPMSRLLQGEVGSGKTIVALRAMLQVVDNGHQCALLAPTEVLAAQHARSMRAMLGPLAGSGELGSSERGVGIALLTGSMGAKAKRQALLDAVSGAAGIVIGTHALIQDGVEFFDLGMVVVDEQHRFGVEQRDALRGRAREGMSPHLLVMTATPIPRTIAMTTLGDLEVSTLRQLPSGRLPINSSVVPAATKPAWVARAWARIREDVAAGRQAYVVCSRIGDEPDTGKEEQNTIAAADLYETLARETLSELTVGLLHGRLPTDEKDAVMRAFAAGEIDVLVCTTVIEVGVDVPNATVMVIVDADRFGISQLHQLRGRVGRGKHQGLCLLITEMPPGSPAFGRLSQVAQTNDGFALAQLDLAARREGDVLGNAQHGAKSTLKLLSRVGHEETIAAAARQARGIVAEDPELERHPGLKALIASSLSADRLSYLSKS